MYPQTDPAAIVRHALCESVWYVVAVGHRIESITPDLVAARSVRDGLRGLGIRAVVLTYVPPFLGLDPAA